MTQSAKIKLAVPVMLALFTAVFLIVRGGIAMSTTEQNAKMIQALLNAPEVSDYIHPEAPGRLPVVVSIADSAEFKASKVEFGGQPIQFVDQIGNAAGSAVFVIHRMSDVGSGTKIEFSYSIEGIKGNAVLVQKDDVFVIGKIEVAER